MDTRGASAAGHRLSWLVPGSWGSAPEPRFAMPFERGGRRSRHMSSPWTWPERAGQTRGMTDGLVLPPGAGRRIESAGMTLKVGTKETGRWSVFEADVAPGFDVGAHVHAEAEELFYILEGELDLLAFEPQTRTTGNWQVWRSSTGATVQRGTAGSLMFVPARCPHAFANPGTSPARMLFLFAPAGHEDYLAEMGQLISRPGPVDPAEIAALRARWDIEQITPVVPGARSS